MKEHHFHHVGFAVEITGTIVVSSITQLETGRDYSNIDVTFVSRVIIGPLNASQESMLYLWNKKSPPQKSV